MNPSKDPPDGGISRRGFLKGAGLGVAATTVLGAVGDGVRDGAGGPATPVLKAGDTHEIAFLLNGRAVKAHVRTGHTLLETLRDQLDHTGTKQVCDHGACGACTVLLDGQPVTSCLVLAVDAAGRTVETIEGLATDGRLHPVQAAFVAEDALQCGFCTPGMVMATKALLDRNGAPNLDAVKAALSGNICRCGTYANIFRAVDRAAKTLKGGK